MDRTLGVIVGLVVVLLMSVAPLNAQTPEREEPRPAANPAQGALPPEPVVTPKPSDEPAPASERPRLRRREPADEEESRVGVAPRRAGSGA
ncbi:MAG: hypothetical protein LBG44_02895 [Gemmatimonadota bacterium]|jgi:hypothetical protein|nr:hypothetical protein [Gemmatimonadota bacterium]